jgi:MFS family permease
LPPPEEDRRGKPGGSPHVAPFDQHSADPAVRLRLSLLMFLQWAVPGALLPLYSVRLVRELHFSDLQTAACCATQATAGVVASLVAGQVADRWLSAERVLALCAAVAGVDLWVLAGLTEPAGVFAATLLFWMVTGPMILMGTTIAFTHLPDPGRQFGPVRMWGTAGWMVTGWLAGCWMSSPDWLWAWLAPLRPDAPHAELADAFRLGGVLALLLAGYARTLPHTPPRRVPGQAPWSRLVAPLAAMRLLARWRFAVYCLCVLGGCTTFPLITQNAPLLLKALGVPDPWLQPTLTVSQTTEVLSLGLLPVLLLRLGLRGTMLLGLSAWALGFGLMALGRPAELVIASLGFSGVFVAGFLVAGQVYANGLAAGDLRASVQGLLSCVNGTGLLLGNLLAGWLRQRTGGDLPPTFTVGAALTAGLLLLFAASFRDPGHCVGRP